MRRTTNPPPATLPGSDAWTHIVSGPAAQDLSVSAVVFFPMNALGAVFLRTKYRVSQSLLQINRQWPMAVFPFFVLV